MATKKDYYEILGVSRDASEDEIKKTFKQIISGEDPLRGTREHFQENISTGIFNGDAGKRIAKYLRQTLS